MYVHCQVLLCTSRTRVITHWIMTIQWSGSHPYLFKGDCIDCILHIRVMCTCHFPILLSPTIITLETTSHNLSSVLWYTLHPLALTRPSYHPTRWLSSKNVFFVPLFREYEIMDSIRVIISLISVRMILRYVKLELKWIRSQDSDYIYNLFKTFDFFHSHVTHL